MRVDPRFFVILGIFSSAAAQIFLKRGSGYDALRFTWVVYIFSSLILYCVAFFCYYIALKYYEISMIATIMMISILALIALYGLVVGENLNYQRVIGIVLAIASIYLVGRS